MKARREKLLFSVVYGLALRDFQSDQAQINLLKARFCDSGKAREPQPNFQILAQWESLQKMNYHIPFPSSIATKLFAIPFFLLAVGLFGFVFYQYIFVGILSSLPEGTQEYVPPPRYQVPIERQGSSTAATSSSVASSTKTEGKSKEERKTEAQILETPTGWLNVRSGPGTSFEQKRRVEPGEKFLLLEKEADWYKIKLNSTSAGWITSRYATTSTSTISAETSSD